MERRAIAYETYKDKVLGCWLGKFIGGTIGAPTEGHKTLMEVTEDNCWPSEIAPNDDLDIQVCWLEVLEDCGPFIDSDDLIQGWQERCWYNFAEYGCFLYNVQRGIMPPLSGTYNNTFYGESMGCPIRAEIWGAVSPGNPALAAEYARMDGQLDHTGDSVYAEQFLAACTAEAFVGDDLGQAIATGATFVPPDSDMGQVIAAVPAICARHATWQGARREIIRRWGHRDCTSVLVNQAFALMALHLAGPDFLAAVLMAANCGWDTDCTAATVGALIGTVLGAKALPKKLVSKVGSRLNCDIAVRHRTATLRDFAEDTCRVGVEVTTARSPGIRIDGAPALSIRGPRRAAIEIAASHPEEPVLTRDGQAVVDLQLSNHSIYRVNGTLSIEAPDGLTASPDSVPITLPTRESGRVRVSITASRDAPVLWDRNVFRATFRPQRGSDEWSCRFGLVGARQWEVYGPYFDIHDTRQSDECPFHNDRVMKNPSLVPGCGGALCHNYVRLDRAYLDEVALSAGPLADEEPFLVERGEDHLDAEHLGGFTGEACYYLVRTIVAREPLPATLCIGSTGPFAVWLNGTEVHRHDAVQPWSQFGFWIPVSLLEGRNRLVLKAIRLTDAFRVSTCFIKPDVPGDKTRGVSFIMDCFGEWLGG